MNILIVANHYCVSSARYATDAFGRLGHSVRHIGPDMGREIWGLTLPQQYAWKPDLAAGERLYFEDGEGHIWGADLIIVMDSDPALLDSMAGGKIIAPMVVWGVDNHVRDYRRPYFDHYFLAHRNVSVMPWHVVYNQPTAIIEGNPYSIADSIPKNIYKQDMTHLPCGFDPHWFTPSPIPFAEREYDVAMLGVVYPQRMLLINAMQEAGLKVLWGCGLVYESAAAAYQNSRVSLCASAAHDVAQRIFETAACNCAVLSDPLPDLELIDYEHPITIYHDIDEAVKLAQTMQQQPELAAECQAWAVGHSWDARAQVIVNWWEATYGAK